MKQGTLAQPRITVVMPVYNGERTIERAIASLQRQTMQDWELIIVDDGSRDTTRERICAADDPRIKLLVQPQNQGGNAARNRGITQARAPFIGFLDCDDEYLPHKLDHIAKYFSNNPKIDAVIDSFALKYPAEMGGNFSPRNNPPLSSSNAVMEAVFNRTVFKATPALSVRKEALLKAGLFDESLRRRQDMDMILRLAKSCEVRTISDVLWTKHWTQGAISSKQGTFMPALIDICERHPEYLSEPKFRKGLSRDFARHFLRLIAQRKTTKAREDWRQFNTICKTHSSASLFMIGTKEIVSRYFSKRDQAVTSEPV